MTSSTRLWPHGSLAYLCRRVTELAQAPEPDVEAIEAKLSALEQAISQAGSGGLPGAWFALGAALDVRVALRPENRDLLGERTARLCTLVDRLEER